MVVQSRQLKPLKTKLQHGWATDGGHEGLVWHELGHVAENFVIPSPARAAKWLRDVTSNIYGGDTLLLSKDISSYSLSNGHELFAEIFNIVNRPGGIASWTKNKATQERLRRVLSYFQEQRLPIGEAQL